MADDQIKVQITADDSGLKTGASDAAASVDKLKGSLSGVSGGAAGAGEGLAGAAAAASTFASSLSGIAEIAGGVFGGLELQQFFDRFKQGIEFAIFGTAELGEQLSNMSMATGMSVDTLQRMRTAAQLTGTDFGTLQRSVSELSIKLLELQSGSQDKTLESAMSVLGLSASDLSDANTALDNIAAALHRVGISEQSIGAVGELLGGRGGSRLIPILEKLDEANQKFTDLNLALDPGQVQAAANAAESFHMFSAEFERAGEGLGITVLPALTKVTDALTKLVQAARSASLVDFATGIGGPYVGAIATAAGAALGAGRPVRRPARKGH